MANRRCFQTLICRYLSTTSHPICKTLTPNSLQTQLTPYKILPPAETSVLPKFCSPFSPFSRHFCSSNRIGDRDDDIDNEGEEDDDDERDEMRENLGPKSDEEKAIEAAEIGYKVIGPLKESDHLFKPYEPLFAVIQIPDFNVSRVTRLLLSNSTTTTSASASAMREIGSHQFKVSNGDSIYVEKLKYCDVNDKLILSKVLMLGSKDQTIIGRPTLPDAAVHAVVEEHALDAKVIIFKKKRRKNYRRTKGHRQELTKLRITDIQGIEKPEVPTSLKTEKRTVKKVEKIAVSA